MDNNITVIGHSYTVQAKGGLSSVLRKDIALDTLRDNLTAFLSAFSYTLDYVENSVSGFHLDEIDVNVEVSAEGSISLIGAVQAGASGGIALKFKRNEQ